MESLTGSRSSDPDADLPGGVAALRQRLDELAQTAASSPEAGAVLIELQTAYEELRVADEEVRAQQEEISRLSESQQAARWQHERLLQMLPVPVVTTDPAGLIRSANAAAASLVGVALPHLVSKPLASFVAVEDRPVVRRELSRLLAGGRWSHVLSLVDRTGSRVLVEVVATAEQESGHATWMFLSPEVDGARRPPGELSLPEALVQMAVLGSAGLDRPEVLRRCARLAQDVLGDRVSLSVNTGPPAAPDALASTSQLAQRVDGAQIAHGEGPCVAAFDERHTVTAPDLRADRRWQRLAADPRTRGVGGVVAVPLRIGDELIGALNVYGDVGDPVDRQLVEETELLAAGMSAVFHELAVRSELEVVAADLERALSSRATIDQAKGIIMAERGGTADEAFDHLVHLSSVQGLKLRDVARHLVERRSAR